MLELNKIYCMKSLEFLKKIDDSSIDCVVTSPPYNKGYWSRNRNTLNGFHTKSRRIQYGDFNDCIEPKDYELQQREILNELLRVIKPSGSIFYNHIDILFNHLTIHPTYIYDFPLKQIIIWNRGNTPKLDKSYFFPITEYIFWLKKSKDARPIFDRHCCYFQNSIWNIRAAVENDHPAPFPLELAFNCVAATCQPNDIVLDCYMGSGTTAIAAIKNKCNYIGCDMVESFVDMANRRIKQEQAQRTLF